MKRELLIAAALSTVLVGCGQQAAESKDVAVVLDTVDQKASYGMGINLGQRIKQDPSAIDIDAFLQGIRDGAGDGEMLMTEEEIITEMQAFQERQQAAAQAQVDQLAADNLAEGAAFLAENGTKDGVVTTESGLQYKVITAGEGEIPTADSVVEVHYAGTLIDGTEFDSSYKRGSTVSFPVTGVIAGWTEALQLMPVGSKWQLFIPSGLAYGPGGTGGGPIGPNATLIFEVELVAIQDEESEG
jgi:FKBP-type peptidyl-prolyl cis-trans isomerase